MLQTGRLILRPFEDADVDALYEIQGDRDYMRFTYAPGSRAECRDWLHRYELSRAANGFAPWTAVARRGGAVIGWGGLNIDPHAPGWGVEVTYFIHPRAAGQGFATEIVRASLGHGFIHLDLDAIGAFAKPENRASVRVLEKCGFTLVTYEPELERNHYEIRREDYLRSNLVPRPKHT